MGPYWVPKGSSVTINDSELQVPQPLLSHAFFPSEIY